MRSQDFDYGRPSMVWNISETEKQEIWAQRRKQEKVRNMIVAFLAFGALFFLMWAKTQIGA